ncbi:heavy metal-associated isoprenylated plant protein 2 [Cryptomeria japonica]|uniref:heavy metal-associated isoprenylated plant protein 2 n=1 Tax=Cryptomeria japonica TaxID=3369 RepID=UPI0027DA7953|nr:heavy metal-associated isoprenylated plant protein 2 [Cryptomeria japonica]
MKKVEVAVEMCCEKCKSKVLRTVAKVKGVNSVEVDTSKNTVTVTGEVDPVKITVEIRKFSKCAQIISVGPHPPPKKTEEKKEKKSQAEEKIYILPACCQRCEGGFYVYDDFDSQNYSFCTII